MGAYKSVQFNNKEQVLQAFENLDIDTWAIFFDKERFAAGEGADELSAALELLERGSSNAIITLRFYADTPIENLKSNAVADYGFNFRLNAPTQTITQYNQASLDYRQELVNKISGLQKEIKELKEGTQENKLGMIGNILDHPVLGNIVEAIGMALIPKLVGGNANINSAISGTVPMQAVGNIATDPILKSAIERLIQFDDKLSSHLDKLATIAEKNPTLFNTLINSIDAMNV